MEDNKESSDSNPNKKEKKKKPSVRSFPVGTFFMDETPEIVVNKEKSNIIKNKSLKKKRPVVKSLLIEEPIVKEELQEIPEIIDNKNKKLKKGSSPEEVLDDNKELTEEDHQFLNSEQALLEEIEKASTVMKKPKPKIKSLIQSEIKEEICGKLYDPCTKEELIRIDPNTGDTNYDLKELEKKVRNIKKIRSEVPSGLYGLANNTSIYEFLMSVFCDKSISLDDMVSFKLHENGQVGSDIYEVLCCLFVIFGGIENVSLGKGGNYKFMLKIEESFSLIEDVKTALQKRTCKASKDQGISDITLIKTKSEEKEIKPDSSYCEVDCDVKQSKEIKTYLMSVKWYQKEKSAEHYDLEKLYIAGQKLVSEERLPFGIIVFLKSKLDFQKAHNRSYRQYVKFISETFFGWNEDVKPFLEDVRKTLFENADVLQKTPQKLIESQYLTVGSKPILSLQLHQDLIVKKINDSMQKEDIDKRYVIGVLPRGGKTFIAGGVIREFIERRKFNKDIRVNILWITAAPNETLSQVGDELILKFQDFEDFNFINIKSEKDILTKRPKINTLYFTSIQLLTARKGGRTKERIFLDNLLKGEDEEDRIHMIFFDEAHAGGAGEESKKVIDDLLDTYSNKIPCIFLTATYLNIIIRYKIIKDNIFIWDYTDVLRTRAIGTESERESAISNLEDRFGEDLVKCVIDKRIKNMESYDAMSRPYINFPELFFISAQFNEEAKDRFASQNLYDPNKGFSLGAIFGLRKDISSFKVKTIDHKIRKDAYRAFENTQPVRDLISLITPTDPSESFEVKEEGGESYKVEERGYDQTILKRIDRISRETNSRFRLDEYPTLLMFLPTGGIGSDINKKLPAFASLLMSHEWWNKRYEVACIISKDHDSPSNEELKEAIEEKVQSLENVRIITENLKSNIIRYERELQCKKGNKKGLVILAGERLSMGISLPCTDVVFLLNETKRPDDIVQKMYRALTPSINKKSAFVVDLNPIRTLAATYSYTRAAFKSSNTKQNKSDKKQNILDIIYDVYSWDNDHYEYNIQKGNKSRILTAQERLKKMLEEASKNDEYKLFINIGELESKFKRNIGKKIKEDDLIPIIKDIIVPKMVSEDGSIRFKNKADVLLKKGQIVIKLKKENNNEKGNEDKKDEEKVDIEIILINNFTEALIDFIKYLAIITGSDNYDDAIKELEENKINNENTGETIKSDIYSLLEKRGSIIQSNSLNKNSQKDITITLFIDIVKKYSIDTSREIFKQMKSKIDEPDITKNKVLTIIHKHLTPKKVEKEKHGAVFTPISIIQNMLDHLPKSIWSDPDMTFLDPANGIGNFPIVAFYKLDEGLKNIIKNEEERRKHIIEKMLFMIEIQSNNTRITKNIFEKLCKGCKPNIWTTDSLKITQQSLTTHGWPTTFDIIMGNPPYQQGGTHQSGTVIWPAFIEIFINFINKNGYLLFINGQGYREYAYGSILELMKNYNLTNINILGNVFPGINYPVDFFVLKNNKNYTKTLIANESLKLSSEINIRNLIVIPNYGWDIFERWNTNKLPRLTFIRTHETSTTKLKKISTNKKNSTYKYPIITKINKNPITTNILYSKIAHPLQNELKILTAFGSDLYPFIDKGEYGFSENVFAIECKNIKEANIILQYLNEPIIKCLYNALKIGTYALKEKLLSLLPNPIYFKHDDLQKNLLLTKTDYESLIKCYSQNININSNNLRKTRKNKK